MGSPINGRMTKPRRRPSQPFTIDAGPFVGMRDSLDPAASDRLHATLLQNCYPEGASVVGRPGFAVMGSDFGLSAMQWVGQYTRLSGAEYTVAIAGGELYTYDWGSDAWTKVVSTANLTTAGITVHNASGDVAAVTFADKLVVTDGAGNTPFTWDGTSGAGGLTKLTNCPPLWGVPTVYYGKLFGIKDSDRATIVWSEEADPTTGYEAAGYTNRWTLGQADTAALSALLGTNEALYVFRERSATAIHGAVTDEFSTTGTRAGVSETVGTASPWAIAVAERMIYFLDADGRPHVLEIGGTTVVPIWRDLAETCATIYRDYLRTARAVYDPNCNLVRFAVRASVGPAPYGEAHLCYAPGPTPQAVARFETDSGTLTSAVAVVKDDDGAPTVMHGGGAYAYRHGTPAGSLWTDGGVAIEHVVQGPYMGQDATQDKAFHRLDATLRGGVTVTEVDVDHETPYAQSTAQTVTVSGDVVRVGLAAQGRWIRPRITHAVAGEQFGLSLLRVSGVTGSDEATTP